MSGETVAGLVMSGLGLLGGGLAFLARRNDVDTERRHDAEAGRVSDNIAALSRRVDEYHADIVKRMDRADERSSKFAGKMQQAVSELQEAVPALQARIAVLEEWRRESRPR